MRNTQVSEFLFTTKEDSEYAEEHGAFITSLFYFLFLAYSSFTFLFLLYSGYFLLDHSEYVFLCYLNLCLLFVVIGLVIVVGCIIRLLYMRLGRIYLEKGEVYSRSASSIYGSIKKFVDFYILVYTCLFFVFVLFNNIGIAISMTVSYVIFLTIGFCIDMRIFKKDALKYYLIGKMSRESAKWTSYSGVNIVSAISYVFGASIMYFTLLLLYSPKDHFVVLTNTLLSIYIVWSMSSFVVCNVYAGYLCSKFRSKYTTSEKGSVKLLFFLIRNIILKTPRIIGISPFYCFLLFTHLFKKLFFKNHPNMRSRIDRPAAPRERYDQIEMEVINYVEFEKYYKKHRSNTDRITSRYWIVTKSMFVGQVLFLSSILSSFSTHLILMKILEMTRYILTRRITSSIHSVNLLRLFSIAQYKETDLETGLIDITEEYSSNVIGLLILKKIDYPNMIHLYRHIISLFCLLMLFLGVRSLESVSFRSLFLLKDAHVEDSIKSAQKSFNSCVRGIHEVFLSRRPSEEMDIPHTELDIYNTTLLGTLSSL